MIQLNQHIRLFTISTTNKERKKDYMKDILEELAFIINECTEDNWDGYRGCRISNTTIATTLQILSSLKYPPDEISPNPQGFVSLYWYTNEGREFNGLSLMLDINSNKSVCYTHISKNRSKTFTKTWDDIK
jgi:hypothetical protein